LVKNPDILILDEGTSSPQSPLPNKQHNTNPNSTPTATSALDAESETLVNSALAALLKGNNTTISIAHRLSTIKRSDRIIVLSSDGNVAEQGAYKDLSADPNGAFTKLMEWQMSGGETTDTSPTHIASEPRGPPTESEEIAHRLESRGDGDGEDDVEEEGLKVRGEKETGVEAVVEKVGKR